MTAEAIERKAIKSQKRKEKADEKREKDKVNTYGTHFSGLCVYLIFDITNLSA